MPDLQPVDSATHPYLCGRFAPIDDEIEVGHLEVEGTLPDGLVGAYLRNGPNEMFPPLGSYTFPMEGDAMVHGVWLDGEGGARYKNRWVRTKGMAADVAAGHDVFGGLMTPAFVDMKLLGDDPDPGWPFRLDPFINVVRHAGRHLALVRGPARLRGHARARHGRPLGLRREAEGDVRPPAHRSRHRRDAALRLRRRGAVPDLGDRRARRHRHERADTGADASTRAS